jgi:hypothetical protein
LTGPYRKLVQKPPGSRQYTSTLTTFERPDHFIPILDENLPLILVFYHCAAPFPDRTMANTIPLKSVLLHQTGVETGIQNIADL